ncbi:MAG: EamA family transporter [Firmicutes bacterium]|nr:EamA family transporter [Bacillota bacterium]
MNNQFKGTLMALTGASLWGILGIFIRNLNAFGLNGMDIAFFRCLLSGIGFMLFNAVTNPDVLKVKFKGLLICFMYGIISYNVGFVSYGFAVERIPVSVATVLMFLCPVWTALLGRIFFKEKLGIKNGTSIIVCLIGAIMVSNVLSVGKVKLDLIGIICALLNGFGVSLQVMIPRFFSKTLKKDTMLVYGFFGAAFVMALFTNFDAVSAGWSSPDRMSFIMNIVFVSWLCTTFANVSMVKSTNYLNTTVSSILSAIEVVVGALVGLLLYKESMSLVQSLGAVIVVLGAIGPNIIPRKSQKGNT